jgi:hypothetical protein
MTKRGVASHHIVQREEAKIVPSAVKVMKTVFWDSEGCILIDFLEKGQTINSAHYVQTLNKLRRELRETRPKKKTVILQHDNGRPHIARLTLQTIQKNS